VQVGGGPAPISATDVAQFQRAAAIRNAFFPAPLPGQAASALQFELIPLGGSGGTLVADGVSHPIAAGNRPGRPVTLQWPSRGSISVAFEGEPAASAWVLDGPWAALRLASRGRLQPTADANRLRLTLVQGGKALDFELRTRSVVHPFGMAELAEFRCPRLTP
jgi:type VI secretion system protein ImpL